MNYTWTQTQSSIIINFPEITEKPSVTFNTSTLSINDVKKVLNGEVKEFCWYFDEYLVVEFEKISSGMWDNLFVNEEVKPENVYNTEMDEETKAMVEKMMYEQKRDQAMGQKDIGMQDEGYNSDESVEEVKECENEECKDEGCENVDCGENECDEKCDEKCGDNKCCKNTCDEKCGDGECGNEKCKDGECGNEVCKDGECGDKKCDAKHPEEEE